MRQLSSHLDRIAPLALSFSILSVPGLALAQASPFLTGATSLQRTSDGATPQPIPAREPLIEIVVPVHNEEAALERSIHRLHRFLSRHMPFPWRIVDRPSIWLT